MRSLNSRKSTPNFHPPTTTRPPVIVTTSPPAKSSRLSSTSSQVSTPSRTKLTSNSIATCGPHPNSAHGTSGRSRPSIIRSSSTRSQQRPVTATTAISAPSSRRSTLSQTSTTSNKTCITGSSSRASADLCATTPTTNNTPSGSRRTSTFREPLLNRDNNARGGPMTRSTRTFTATMAPEKGPNANARQGPSLAKGVMGRSTPLTPKIATPTGQPRIAQPTAASPLARRAQPGNGPTKEEYAPPVSSFHNNNNITPRSGSRQNRVDSAHNSPGTPYPERKDGWESRVVQGVSTADGDATRRAGTPSGEASKEAQASADAKFFYASDAKGSQPKPPAAPQPRTGGNFFYASGGAVENEQNAHAPDTSTSPPFTPVLSHTLDNRSSKFMYASGVPNLEPAQNQTGRSRPSSVSSGTSRPAIGRTQGSQPSSVPQHQRPASPVKTPQHPTLSAYWNSQQSLPNSTRSPNALAPSAVSPSTTANRRVSIEGVPQKGHSRSGASQKGHSRSGSLPNAGIESPPPSKGIPSIPSSEISTPCSVSNPTMTLASPLQPVEDRVTEAASNSETATYSGLHSPSKPSYPNDPLSELIANARRDRKVQDLEITNTSLTAINRSLEKRLRKQTAELRRYRRLSRAGRLSLGSTVSSAITRDSLASDTGTEGFSLTDLSEEELEMSEEESELSETDSGSESLSPEARAARDARHRQKDERRLEIDLTKHRELLIDSQKINQSLKNCLNWTEELINDGRKALAYQVRVSDIKLGGRVLPPDDDDDDDEDSVAVSERLDDTMHRPAIVSGDPDAPWVKEQQDRDSGVEFPAEAG
ncbi:hypothetical protein VUR80DRAFT_2855 [Thermomyces stellatus]